MGWVMSRFLDDWLRVASDEWRVTGGEVTNDDLLGREEVLTKGAQRIPREIRGCY